MVRFKKKNGNTEIAIIEMSCPSKEYIVLLQKELLNLISGYDHTRNGEVEGSPFFLTTCLLESLLITEEEVWFNEKCRVLMEMQNLSFKQLNEWAVNNLKNYKGEER